MSLAMVFGVGLVVGISLGVLFGAAWLCHVMLKAIGGKMKAELQQNLAKKYPNLYRDLGGNQRDTCMAYGLDVGDGWYPLIEELSAKLEILIVAFPEASPERQIRVAQVKEKFGLLRYYLEGPVIKEMTELIHETETKSGSICERCEAPVKSEKWDGLKHYVILAT